MADSIAIGVAYSDPAISGGTVNNTVIGATTAAAGTFTTMTATGSAVLGDAAADTIGCYGKTPVAQRAYSAAVHNTTGVAVSASFGATQLAALQEVQLTLIGLGIYATA